VLAERDLGRDSFRGGRGGIEFPVRGLDGDIRKAAAERTLASYWQVNNTANESRSDTVLKTVEAGSSYSMDVGTSVHHRHHVPDVFPESHDPHLTSRQSRRNGKPAIRDAGGHK
jgi:hypothetical protein